MLAKLPASVAADYDGYTSPVAPSAWPLPVVALCAAVACGAAGALCGFICHRFGAQSLVVTLGMYSILLSGALVVTGSNIGGTPPPS